MFRSIEFVILYIIAPILLTIFAQYVGLFVLLLPYTLICLWLLHKTETFNWGSLAFKGEGINIKAVFIFGLIVFVSSIILILFLAPERLFSFPKSAPIIWLMVMILYPLISALPQEISYRVLYYERYNFIFSKFPEPVTHMFNGLLFSFAHLVYGQMVVFILTFLGGICFSLAYKIKRNFWYAVVLHGLAGNIIFTSGLGWYFCLSCQLP